MCADPYQLKKNIEIMQNENIDYLHIDIMDGHFVPNYGLGLDFCKKLKEHTNIPFDYHLMIEEPHKLIPKLDLCKNDIVSVHYEATYCIQEVIEQIKGSNAKFFIALKPETPIIILGSILDFIDGINFLTVTPGFAGQKMSELAVQKFQNLVKYLKNKNLTNLELEVDGNMTLENIQFFNKLGANIFVAGSSSLFGGGACDMSNIIKKIRLTQCVEK